MPQSFLKVCHHASDTYTIITYGREKGASVLRALCVAVRLRRQKTLCWCAVGNPRSILAFMCLHRAQTGAQCFIAILQLPLSSYFQIGSIHICSHLKFLYQVFTFNNLIRNNYFKFYYYYYWYQILGGTCCHFQDRPKDGDATFIRNVGIYLPNYMASVFKLIKNSV